MRLARVVKRKPCATIFVVGINQAARRDSGAACEGGGGERGAEQ
jgi:hypothetical protein